MGPPVTHQLASRGGLSHEQESTLGTLLQSMNLRRKTDLLRGPRGLHYYKGREWVVFGTGGSVCGRVGLSPSGVTRRIIY